MDVANTHSLPHVWMLRSDPRWAVSAVSEVAERPTCMLVAYRLVRTACNVWITVSQDSLLSLVWRFWETHHWRSDSWFGNLKGSEYQSRFAEYRFAEYRRVCRHFHRSTAVCTGRGPVCRSILLCTCLSGIALSELHSHIKTVARCVHWM